jgi:hypothetical protein
MTVLYPKIKVHDFNLSQISPASDGWIKILGKEAQIEKINKLFFEILKTNLGRNLIIQLMKENKKIIISDGIPSMTVFERIDNSNCCRIFLDLKSPIFETVISNEDKKIELKLEKLELEKLDLDSILVHELAHCLDDNKKHFGPLTHPAYGNIKEWHAIEIYQNPYKKEKKGFSNFRIYHLGCAEWERDKLEVLASNGAFKNVKEKLMTTSYEDLKKSHALLYACLTFQWDVIFLLIEKELELRKKAGRDNDKLDENFYFTFQKAIEYGSKDILIKLLNIKDLNWDYKKIEGYLSFAKREQDNKNAKNISLLIYESFVKYKKGKITESKSAKDSLNIKDYVLEEVLKLDKDKPLNYFKLSDIEKRILSRLNEKKLVHNPGRDLKELIDKYSNKEYSPENIIKYLMNMDILSHDTSLEAKKLLAELQAPVDIERTRKEMYLHNPLLREAEKAIIEAERILAELKPVKQTV